jgi:hypothetical protein
MRRPCIIPAARAAAAAVTITVALAAPALSSAAWAGCSTTEVFGYEYYQAEGGLRATFLRS